MNQERLLNVLRAPHVSEKANTLGESKRQFVFEVANDATKPQIAEAVEKMFSVKVRHVRVCNVYGKVKRMGRFSGRRSQWKKAYVTLLPGHDIDFVGGN